MSRSDEHLDELKDRERRGLLGLADRERLEAHRAICATCRFERQIPRMLFREAEMPVDAAVLDRIVSGAMAAAQAPAPRKRPRSRTATIALASAAALVAGLAMAAVMQGRADTSSPLGTEGVTAQVTGQFAKAEAERAEEAAAEAKADPIPLPIEAEALPSTPKAAEAPPALSIKKSTPASRGSGPATQLPSPMDEARGEAPAMTAAELFARANQARLRGADDEALSLYRDLSERFPTSREALTSRVALGRLLLDSGRDAREALALFDAYLLASPDGTLVEEALLGRALSFERLGDSAGERDAWRALLERRPDSVHGDRARTKLRALGD